MRDVGLIWQPLLRSYATVFATPATRVRVDKELFPFAHKTLDHCAGVVSAMDLFQSLNHLIGIFRKADAVIKPYFQASVVC